MALRPCEREFSQNIKKVRPNCRALPTKKWPVYKVETVMLSAIKKANTAPDFLNCSIHSSKPLEQWGGADLTVPEAKLLPPRKHLLDFFVASVIVWAFQRH